MNTYVWMQNGNTLVVVAPTISIARQELVNRIGRPRQVRHKKWDVEIEPWLYTLLKSKPIKLRQDSVHAVFDVSRAAADHAKGGG